MSFFLNKLPTYILTLSTLGYSILKNSDLAIAQILSDGSITENINQSNNEIEIDGGLLSGNNLLHSFSNFSVNTGKTVIFLNNNNATNIITRVTGQSVSNIDGILKVPSNANLFLLNPKGISFGANAQLDLNGSFVASTAKSIGFNDQYYFDIDDPSNLPSFSITNPTSLIFGNLVGDINLVGNSTKTPKTTLKVPDGKMLALLGGDISIDASNLIALSGQIELSSVGENSQLEFQMSNPQWSFNYDQISLFKNINLSNDAFVQVSGNSGSVNLSGYDITLVGGAQVENNTTGAMPGGSLTLNAENSITISGTSNGTFAFPSGVFAQVQEPNGSFFPTTSFATGKGGNIGIKTNYLILKDGGTISTGTLSLGDGGSLIINAADFVQISGIGTYGVSQLTVSTNNQGDGGDLVLNTKQLLLSEGGGIEAITYGKGAAGNLELNVSDSTIIDGIMGVSIDPDKAPSIFRSGISASSKDLFSFKASGNGGNINLNTNHLIITNGGQISVSSLGSQKLGDAGNLNIFADAIVLDNNPNQLDYPSEITAQTNSGEGGGITLNVNDFLLLRNGSQISATAGVSDSDQGNGGNINISSPFIISLPKENSDITANAFAGNGGQINIKATGLLGLVNRPEQTALSDITASSKFGQSGTVTISTPDVDVSKGLVELPGNLIDSSALIAQNVCAKDQKSEFVVAGRGGLPANPIGTVANDIVLPDLGLTSDKNIVALTEFSRATGWQIASNGQAILTANKNTKELITEGRKYYQLGQFEQAIASWTEAATNLSQQGDRLGYSMVLSNLGAAFGELGEWQKAKQAINASVQIIAPESSEKKDPVMAQILMTQGNLAFNLGQDKQALGYWKQAKALYKKVGDKDNILKIEANQTKTLQRMGYNQQAYVLANDVVKRLDKQEDSLLKIKSLQLYGISLQSLGKNEDAKQTLEKSLEIANRLNLPQEIASAKFTLGAAEVGQGNFYQAIQAYQKVLNGEPTPLLKLQTQLNLLGLYIQENRVISASKIIPEIQPQIDALPINQATIAARLNFATSLLTYRSKFNDKNISSINIVEQLKQSAELARQIGDRRLESFSLGYLGHYYENNNNYSQAKELTEKALAIAEEVQASDITYRWQWQLGRIAQNQENLTEVIAAYQNAYQILQSLRKELATAQNDVQFSFRESVEPVYRQFVALLLKQSEITLDQTLQKNNILKARDIIESLQLAELDNFFQDACSTAKPVSIDQVDQSAAVIYPIILPNSLDVIISIPGQAPKHYKTEISQKEAETTVNQLQKELFENPIRFQSLDNHYIAPATKIYNWLIRPAEADLKAHNVKTLSFVLDGVLRNIPMAVLYDGKQHLVENYAIALTPGMQLLNPQSLQKHKLIAVTGGLTEARQNFVELPNVQKELQEINQELPSQVILNNKFTETNLEKEIKDIAPPIVHLATHGEFSSKAEDTFILTWDSRINANQLEDLFVNNNQDPSKTVELLVLSACQTATGDKRAALGLAGMAVRAGVRSTLATLWFVDDEATSLIMREFYQELTQGKVTKAEALRQAQLNLIHSEAHHHPFYWASYVLIGNWL